MGKQSNRKLVGYLPLALATTFLVAVCPLLLVWWLRGSGIVSSAWVASGIAVGLSFGASYVGGALWKTRAGAQDVLFGELMLWGWVQRWRIERRLSAATDLLGLAEGRPRPVAGGRLTHEQRAKLLSRLASALEARDPYTHGHSRRVARHASNIAKRMGVSRGQLAKVRTAAAMHDVGKLKTPNAVLHKEGKLTEAEFDIVKRHPVEGATMVSTLRDYELTAMVRHHHERLDGTGYPDRLSGDAIPLGARIIAVADTFDAITSIRAYRPARAHKRALDILRAEAGTQLDPEAVRAFCSCYAGMRPLAWWTALTSVPQKIVSWFGQGLGAANAASVASVMAIAATTGALGGVALGALVKAPTPSHRALGSATRSADALAASTHPVAPLSARPGGARGPDGGKGGARPGRGAHWRSVAPSARRGHGRAHARTSASGVALTPKRDRAISVAPVAPRQAQPVTPAPAQAPRAGQAPSPGGLPQRGVAHGHPRGQGHGHRGITERGVARGRRQGHGRRHGHRHRHGHGHRRGRGRGRGHGHGDRGITGPDRTRGSGQRHRVARRAGALAG